MLDDRYLGGVTYVRQKGVLNFTRHYLFHTWRMMNVRCLDKTHKAFHRYGGRGINVCLSWRWDNEEGFINFLNDVGDRPEGYTLDRLDNDGNYFKLNCKWSSKKEQQNNLSIGKRNKSGVIGISEHRGKWNSQIVLNGRSRVIKRYSLEDFDIAVAERDEVLKVKSELGDDAAIMFIKTLKDLSPLGRSLTLNTSSRFYGVSYSKDKCLWRAYVNERVEGKLKQVSLGLHENELDAYFKVLDRLLLTGRIDEEHYKLQKGDSLRY